jgi:putative sterol carrier protein
LRRCVASDKVALEGVCNPWRDRPEHAQITEGEKTVMAKSIEDFFSEIAKGIDPEKIKGINATYQWKITGEGGGDWFAVIGEGALEVSAGESMDPDITITVSARHWLDIVNGNLNPQMAFVSGKVQIVGDMMLAMKLQNLLH